MADTNIQNLQRLIYTLSENSPAVHRDEPYFLQDASPQQGGNPAVADGLSKIPGAPGEPGGGWEEWSNWVLRELIRLGDEQSRMANQISQASPVANTMQIKFLEERIVDLRRSLDLEIIARADMQKEIRGRTVAIWTAVGVALVSLIAAVISSVILLLGGKG